MTKLKDLAEAVARFDRDAAVSVLDRLGSWPSSDDDIRRLQLASERVLGVATPKHCDAMRALRASLGMNA